MPEYRQDPNALNRAIGGEREYIVTFKDGTVIRVWAINPSMARMKARGRRPVGKRSDDISHTTINYPHDRSN